MDDAWSSQVPAGRAALSMTPQCCTGADWCWEGNALLAALALVRTMFSPGISCKENGPPDPTAHVLASVAGQRVVTKGNPMHKPALIKSLPRFHPCVDLV